MSVSAEARVRPTPDVLISELGDELVFLELGSEQYFGLDSVGRSIWKRLTTEDNVGKAIDALLEEFDVDRPTLTNDVDRLVEELMDKGLLKVTDDAAP